MSKSHGVQVHPRVLQKASRLVAFSSSKPQLSCFILLCLALLASTGIAAQGKYTLFGDLKVDESNVEGPLTMSFQVILYTEAGTAVGRQSVVPGGRYNFSGLRNGNYELAVVVDNRDVVRVRAVVGGSIDTEYRKDLELEWRPNSAARKSRPQAVSVADHYERTADHQALFDRAQSTLAKRKYADAKALLQQLLASDPKDFYAWTALGTAFFLQDKIGDAEKAYRSALDQQPMFAPALLNLGRVLIAQKKFESAIAPLTQVSQQRNDSADANFLLGEVYLQLKKGSQAVPYLNAAARLGQADAHLRLAQLYNAAGMKSQAAAEYQQFLKKRPDYPDREKLQKYIAEQGKN